MKNKFEELCNQLTVEVLSEEKISELYRIIKELIDDDFDENVDYLEDLQESSILDRLHQGKSLLHYACMRNDSSKIINFLLEKGAKPNILDNQENTPLHLACSQDVVSIDIVKTLLDKGASPTIINDEGMNVLCCLNSKFLENNIDYEVIALLLQKGAKPINTYDPFESDESSDSSDDEKRDGDRYKIIHNLLQFAVDSNNCQLGLHLLFHEVDIDSVEMKEVYEVEGNNNKLWPLIKLLKEKTPEERNKFINLIKFHIWLDNSINMQSLIKECLNPEGKKEIETILLSMKHAPSIFKHLYPSKIPMNIILHDYLCDLSHEKLCKIINDTIPSEPCDSIMLKKETAQEIEEIIEKAIEWCSPQNQNKRKRNEEDPEDRPVFKNRN